MKYAFIREHLGAYPVDAVCDVLAVSRSGYYAWRDRPASKRWQRQRDLAAKIRVAHAANRGVYDSPRIWRLGGRSRQA